MLYLKKKDCRVLVRPRFQIDFTPLWHVLAVVYICDDHYSSETVHLNWRCRVLSSNNLLVLRSSHCIFPIISYEVYLSYVLLTTFVLNPSYLALSLYLRVSSDYVILVMMNEVQFFALFQPTLPEHLRSPRFVVGFVLLDL